VTGGRASGPSPGAWEALLSRLGDGAESAGAEYEQLRRRLVRFFEWSQSSTPEDLADIVINRVAGKLEAGEPVTNVHAYAMGVARFVLKESRVGPRLSPLDDAPPSIVAARPPSPEDDAEQRAACLDRCLSRMPDANRELVLRYYEGEGRSRIDIRRDLAAKLEVTDRALRLRLYRLRESLQECIHTCLARGGSMRIVKHIRPSSHSS
jgi:DNA-directed RNA polymerase specialized sigma24 family protein